MQVAKMSPKQKSNQCYLHNERLDSEQEKELWLRSPENPVNKRTLSENGFQLTIGRNANAETVKQILKFA